MADLKITDLGAALSVGDSNVTVLDDGSSTMKVTMNQLKEYSIGTTDISGIGNGTATGAISSVNTSKNNVRDSIAPTETSTASRAYEVDEKMYISDVLYKATRAIALGDSLVSGTNITPANDVSTEILELKSDASEAIDSVKNIIAPVEDGGTAVLSYSAGDQFIHLGALCKAKTTINAGDTFIINTNYEDAGQVVDQLDSVKQALSNEVVTRATLGTSNLDVPINEEAYNATYSRSNNGYQVISTVSGTWTNVGFYYKLPKNKDLKILTNVSHSAGSPRIAVYGNSIPSESGRTNIITKEISADGAVEVSFNTGNYEYIAIALFASINTAAQGNVTYSNFIIKLSNDPNTSYTEPAKTNRELTDGKAEKSDLASISITGTTNTTGATITSGTYFYLNGVLVKAKTGIANGATLTSGTNYENVTTGSLNQLQSLLNSIFGVTGSSPSPLSCTSMKFSGTDDYFMQVKETGDEDYKGIQIKDKNDNIRYSLTFKNGHLFFYSKDASGNMIVNETQII